MDGITLSQHDLIKQWSTWPSSWKPWRLQQHARIVTGQCRRRPEICNVHRRSAICAFWAVGLLNLPIYSFITALSIRRVHRTMAAWESWSVDTISGRLLSHSLESVGFKRWFCQTHQQSMWRNVDLPKWVPLFGIRSSSLAEEQYWTIITSNFAHVNPAHLAGNMVCLWQFAPVCADIPGLNWMHVCAVTLIACLSSSMASLAQIAYFPSPDKEWVPSQAISLGFSGINMAFLGIAAMGSPKRPISHHPIPIPVPCWAVCGVAVLMDIQGILHIMGVVGRAPWSPKMENIGHLTHLAGFGTGALYYWLILRHRPCMPTQLEIVPDES